MNQRSIAYKHLADRSTLAIDVIVPDDLAPGERRPAAVFFHGGGWQAGSRDQFAPQATRLAELGMVCLLVEYRTESSHGTPPPVALADAKSAMRWVLSNAAALQIDPARIAVCGASAGAHLAAAACMCPGFDDPQDDTSIPIRPCALVLFNPVIDNGPDGYGYDRTAAHFPAFSPAHNVRPGLPPCLILLGTRDHLIPVETARKFEAALQAAHNPCQLILYEGAEHGFFNYRDGNNPYYEQTLNATIRFFTELRTLRSRFA